jgi:hypothetical protein
LRLLLGYVLIALVPVLCVAWILWNHRKKTAEREAARGERLAELLGARIKETASAGAPASSTAVPAPTEGATAPAAAAARLPQAAPVAVAPASAESPAAALYAAKPCLLAGPHAQLYRDLRNSLPGYAVFAQVSLASILEVPASVQGRTREQRQRVLAHYTVDCVVCSPDLRVIAVAELETATDAESRLKAECLKAAGIRHVRIDPSRPVAGDQLKALVLG